MAAPQTAEDDVRGLRDQSRLPPGAPSPSRHLPKKARTRSAQIRCDRRFYYPRPAQQRAGTTRRTARRTQAELAPDGESAPRLQNDPALNLGSDPRCANLPKETVKASPQACFASRKTSLDRTPTALIHLPGGARLWRGRRARLQ